jgi:hypothetical protein
MIYFERIDKLMEYFSSGDFKAEAVEAKGEFSRLSGVMDEGTPGYEMKFNQFSDWYLFTRKLSSKGKTPIQIQVDSNPLKVSDDQKDLFVNLLNSRHSLFLFLKLSKQDITVRDLFSSYKLVIKDSPVVHGFEKDSPFEGRLIPHENSFFFSNSFCFHPVEAKKYINQEIKRVSKLPENERDQAREDLILKLFKMKYKFEQYTHVSVADIYTEDSRLKF